MGTVSQFCKGGGIGIERVGYSCMGMTGVDPTITKTGLVDLWKAPTFTKTMQTAHHLEIIFEMVALHCCPF